jgi:UDP-N-acetylmuramoyl-L-alanyl-D-glutamate--2,6-diaminopimelate ligase
MKLSALLGSPVAHDVEVTGLAIDSRACTPGCVFGAFGGTKTDGAKYIAEAVAKGAGAVVAVAGVDTGSAFHVVAENPRAKMADVATRWFGAQPRLLIAVTGTNGKTSTVELARQLLTILGHAAASIGTLGIISPGDKVETGMTSPDVLSFHRTLKMLADGGVDAAAFEASSHALDQYRVHGARLKAAAFTNLTRDHLDYHGTLENYGAAKEKLFLEILPADGTAVINADDPFGAALAAKCAARGQTVLRFGKNGTELKLLQRDILLQGQHLTVTWQGTRVDILLPLVGEFQAYNALAATGLLIGAGADAAKVFSALAKVQGVPGRLENVAVTRNGAAVYVDYAHTPDGLRAALDALRPHTQARLIVVFGCGGDRDRGKRPQMGALACDLADFVIVTDDNPRTEDAAAIRRDVMGGAKGAVEIGDRRRAIAAAIDRAGPGDVVLVAGKGHEQGQIIGTTVTPFHDGTVVQQIVGDQAA